MPLPIIPILIGGLVLLAAAGKKKGGGNGNGGRPPHLPPGHGRVTIGPGGPPPDDGGGGPAPGAPCAGLPAGEYGGYDEQGNCVIFWDENTRDILVQAAGQIIGEKGYTMEQVCAPDEQDVEGNWVLNPKREEVTRQALGRIYEVTPNYWPPVEDSPYWIGATWNAGSAAVRQDLCNMP